MINIIKNCILFCIVLTAIFSSSSVGGQETEAVSRVTRVITGTVRHFSEEGGFYGIEADDGSKYKPINLPGSFQRDGLNVKVMARPINGKLLTHGWGTPVEILDIETRR